MQSSGARGERLGGNADTWRDRAAQIVAVGGDHIPGGGRAEVDDNSRRAVKSLGRKRVDEAVCAHLAGTIDQHAQAQVDLNTDDQRVNLPVALREIAEDGRERGHHRRDRTRVQLLDVVAAPGEEVIDHHGVFVGGAARVGSRAPRLFEACAIIEAEDNICVSDVNG